jgi:hypothetical protein
MMRSALKEDGGDGFAPALALGIVVNCAPDEICIPHINTRGETDHE